MKEGLEMVAHKIGRILNGDPTYADSWHDISGYATLVENELTGSDGSTTPPPAPTFKPDPDGQRQLSPKSVTISRGEVVNPEAVEALKGDTKLKNYDPVVNSYLGASLITQRDREQAAIEAKQIALAKLDAAPVPTEGRVAVKGGEVLVTEGLKLTDEVEIGPNGLVTALPPADPLATSEVKAPPAVLNETTGTGTSGSNAVPLVTPLKK